MTQIFCVRDKECAYLLADSAVTGGASASLPSSTFGESHVEGQHNSENISERALKIAHLGSCAIAMCGRAHTAIKLIEEVRGRLAQGYAPHDAFTKVCRSNSPISRKRTVGLVMIAPALGGAAMLGFKSDSDEILVATPGTNWQLGSMPVAMKMEIRTNLQKLYQVGRREGEAFVVKALAYTQGVGMRHNLMAHGVGGAYVAAFADERGLHWQPDILYAIYDHYDSFEKRVEFVSSIVRGHALVVQTTLHNSSTIVFGSASSAKANGVSLDLDAFRAYQEYLWTGAFDYMIYLNRMQASVAIFELRRKTEVKHIKYERSPPPDGARSGRVALRLSDLAYRSLMMDLKDWEGDEEPTLTYSFFAYDD